jgi:TonB-linked SusC/RagA family outer membrane protein
MKICTTNFCRKTYIPKFLRVMKITAFLILICIMHVSANTYAQKINISKTNTPLNIVIDDISKQSGYDIVFDASLINRLKPVTVNIKDATIQTALDICLKNEPLTYNIEGKLVVLKFKSQVSPVTATEAQVKDIAVTGRVLDEKGKPVPGATVKIQTSQIATSTKEDGTYRIMVPDEKTVLVYSFIGYESQSVIVGSKKEINVSLKEQDSHLNEVVVVGYGTLSKKDVTTSISSLRSADINDFPSTGVDKAMTGKLAGVQVLQPNGAPGAGISIAIRGKSTITAGSDPLYVVDGQPLSDNDVNGPGLSVNPLNAINMDDIESVDVLKDASAAAIYGSRGSNGVVIITTKRGKTDKPLISYNAYYGIQQTTKKIPLLDAYQYAQLIYDAHNNTYLDLLADKNLSGSPNDDNATRLSKLGAAAGSVSQSYLLPPEIVPYLAGQPDLTNTDWQAAIFRNAPVQSHTISATGGSNNVKYYISGNYLDQDGIVIASGYKKYGGRVNLDASYGKLKLGVSINYIYAQYQFQPTEGRFSSNENIVAGALTASPFFPIYNTDGSYNYNQYNWQYGQSQSINPVALANLKTDVTAENKLLSNIFAQYNFTPDLSDKISFGTDVDDFNRSAYRPSTLPTVSPSLATSTPTGEYRNTNLVNWVAENTLAYNKRFGDHSIQAIGGCKSNCR